MVFQHFDLFASDFQFHLEKNQQRRKKSFIGGVISIAILSVAIVYFAYLMYIYSTNQIDPKYKMQSFISEEMIDFTPDNEYYGFNLILNSTTTLSMLEEKTGLSYINFIPAFQISRIGQETQYIILDVIKCKSQKLSGYMCIDFSKSQNYHLAINNLENFNADLILVAYKCTDTDFFKQVLPSNCALDKDIDSIINDRNGFFELKMKTSQYNTTSENMEIRYKKYIINFQGNLMVYSKQKSMKLITEIKKGPLIQSAEKQVSIIDYIKEERTFDRETLKQQTNISAIAQIAFSLDEQIQYIQIQYATFLEVMSIFNSTFAILMGIGLFGRYFSRQIIYNEFKLSILKDMYSQSFAQILQMKQKYFHEKNNLVNDLLIPYQNLVKHLQQNARKNSDKELKNNQNSYISPQDSKCELSSNDENSPMDQNQLQQIQQSKLDVGNINSLIKSKIALNTPKLNASANLQQELQYFCKQSPTNMIGSHSPSSFLFSDGCLAQNQSENKLVLDSVNQKQFLNKSDELSKENKQSNSQELGKKYFIPISNKFKQSKFNQSQSQSINDSRNESNKIDIESKQYKDVLSIQLLQLLGSESQKQKVQSIINSKQRILFKK